MTDPAVAEAQRLATIAEASKSGRTDDDATAPDAPDAPDGAKRSAATRLVELALQLYELHVDDTGAPFAIQRDGANLALPFRAGSLGMRAHLAHSYYATEGRAAPSAALADALVALEGQAAATVAAATHLRTAPHAGGVVLDLGTPDGSVVVIDSAGWRVTPTSPVTFRRTAVTGPLPIPVAGGSLDELRHLLHVTDTSWPLLIGWLVAAILPELPHPILSLRGPMGSAKSTTATRLVSLVDPSPAPLRTAPRDAESWVITAASSWIVALDNVSTIPPWMQDALCRAVTGDGLVRRQLYTDSAVTVVTMKRAVILTSIDVGAMRGDLADRLVRVELERIGGTARRTDAELNDAFAAAHPRILGALLDLVAGVLAHLPTVTLDTLPRMADFARVLAAVDHAAGLDSLAKYRALGKELMTDVVDDDPVATAVVALAKRKGEWSGTAQELHALLTSDRPPKGWPAQARTLVTRLMNAATALRAVGVEVTRERTSTARTIRVAMAPSPGGDGRDDDDVDPSVDIEEVEERTTEAGTTRVKKACDLSSPSSPSSRTLSDQAIRGDDGRRTGDGSDDGPRPGDDAPPAHRHRKSPGQTAYLAAGDDGDDAIRAISHGVDRLDRTGRYLGSDRPPSLSAPGAYDDQLGGDPR